jgi:hypothetical protein
MAYTTINKSTSYFNTKLYTGDGGTNNAQTGVGFKPDWLWLKRRDGSANHFAADIVRGTYADGYKLIVPNDTDAQADYTYVKSLDSDGFTLGSTNANVNGNSNTYVGWSWLAGGSQGSSNTDGSTNTTYTSVNTTAGFSISTYAGTGSAATIGHGLGVAPKVVLIKSTSHTENWVMYHASLGAGKYIYLNNADGAGPGSGTNTSIFNNTAPTSSVFTVNTDGTSNGSGKNYVAYCFAEKTGYSKFGSYTGNGNTDGMFVYTGFKPALIILKHSNSNGNNWRIIDNKRDPDNVTQKELYPSTNDAEGSSDRMDLLSNGFKLRSSGSPVNDGEYIYMAFAEEPLVANVGQSIPATAR